MISARSFSYSHPPSALSTALETAHGVLPLCERRSPYNLLQVHPEPTAPEPAATCFPSAIDVIDLYFDDAIRNSRTTLLTHQEEVELAQAIEQGKCAAAELAAERLSNGRHSALELLVQRGENAREQLIKANLRLVVTVADWYRNSPIPLADLIQEGNIGLMQAADKYDWRRGTRFSTYAVWWIRQAIARSLANDSRLIRIPVHAHQKLALIARTKRDLYRETGIDPSPADIADHTGLPEGQVRDLLPHLLSPTCLDAPIETQGGAPTSLAAATPDSDVPSTEDQAVQSLAREALQRALNSLTPREEQLLTRRYGLTGTKGLSLRAAGEALGLTKGQAQVIETNAFAKLRRQSTADTLRGLV